jgi:hypothetical protein
LSSGSDLRDCDLNRQILTKRDLSGSDLREAILDGADLGGVCLRDALLVETSLRGVTLKDATLCGANLSRADLSGARVLASQLECALICCTAMPDGSLRDDDRGTNRACKACDDACAKDQTCCQNTCVKPGADTKHCARCGNERPPPTASVSATCGQTPDPQGRLVHDCLDACDAGWEDCDGDFDTGREVFMRGDNNNCGGCGAHCAEGMVCCNCTCVPVGSDRHGVCPTITSVRLIRRR